MAANKDKERPGVIIRFDAMPTLQKMSDEAKALYLMACLYRGQDPSYDVDISQVADPLDAVRLETLWTVTAPAIDRDAAGWINGKVQTRYATYCRKEKAQGREPLTFEEYKEWMDRQAVEAAIKICEDAVS